MHAFLRPACLTNMNAPRRWVGLAMLALVAGCGAEDAQPENEAAIEAKIEERAAEIAREAEAEVDRAIGDQNVNAADAEPGEVVPVG